MQCIFWMRAREGKREEKNRVKWVLGKEGGQQGRALSQRGAQRGEWRGGKGAEHLQSSARDQREKRNCSAVK